MGINADKTLIQMKMLNSSKGPAVRSLRAQEDKKVYPKVMMEYLKNNPNLVIIQSGTDETDSIQQQCENEGQDYVQVRSQIYAMLSTGGYLKSAYEEIRTQLYQYTTYNQQVSLTVLPIYYLQLPVQHLSLDEPILLPAPNIEAFY